MGRSGIAVRLQLLAYARHEEIRGYILHCELMCFSFCKILRSFPALAFTPHIDNKIPLLLVLTRYPLRCSILLTAIPAHNVPKIIFSIYVKTSDFFAICCRK